MIYNCNITKNTDNFYEVCFPDMPHIITIGFSHESTIINSLEYNTILTTEHICITMLYTR